MNATRAQIKTAGFALGIFALALAVRLPFLGRAALWGDEMLFVKFLADADLSPWQVFLDYWDACTDLGQLPLAGVLLNVYLHLVGRFVPDAATRAFVLRLPGVFAGALAVVGVHALGRRWAGRPVAWTATAMATFFFFPVYYSREVYCYPYVLLCAAFSLAYFFRCLFDERPGWRTHLAFGFWTAGLGLTHYGCSTVLAAMGFLATGHWARNVRRSRPEFARRAAKTAGATALAGLAVAPYWARILLTDNPHIAGESAFSVFFIANDVVAKLFLGDRLVPAALAWLLLAAGLATMLRRPSDAGAARTAANLFLLAAALLIVLTKKSQYASARYFAPLAPLAYLIFAEGLWSISLAMARLCRRPRSVAVLFAALATALVAVHAGLFLPVLYRLEEKGVPYATTARWLNENGVPGAPYFFDCGGFDQRYVPGFCETPGLIHTVDIAGNGPGFIDDVRGIQRGIMERFPVSYYVRDPANPWDEADRFYRNAVEHRNPSLDRLRRLGIAPFADNDHVPDDAREILFNTRADAIAIAQQAGRAIFVDYPGFRCAPVVPGVYGHVVDGREATLDVLNLRDAPLRGSFRISGAISAASGEATLELALPGGGRDVLHLPTDRIWTVETPAGELPSGRSALRLAVSAPPVDKLLLMDVHFVER